MFELVKRESGFVRVRAFVFVRVVVASFSACDSRAVLGREFVRVFLVPGALVLDRVLEAVPVLIVICRFTSTRIPRAAVIP